MGLPRPFADASRGIQIAALRIVEAHDDAADRLAADDALAAALQHVVHASRSLTNLLVADAAALDRLADLDTREPVQSSTADALVGWKRREVLRIAARDLMGLDALEQVGGALSAMAANVLHSACLLTQARDLAVIGMGKLAGNELNYASDVDVMFVGEGNAAALAEQARAVLSVASGCFKVDADLRPEGGRGPLVRTLSSYEAYWERWAEPWEFQALMKASSVAGDEDLGSAFDEASYERVWSRRWESDDLRQLRALKARAEEAVGRAGVADREVKRGPGGIRDVEFAVQLLQLVHGRHDPALRVANTLTALAEVAEGGYVDRADALQLADSYRYLRGVEHRLQLVDERQTHTVPDDPESAARLDLSMDELRRHRADVREIYERLWFRPALEAFSSPDAALDEEALAERLHAFGFRDVDRTRDAVAELTRGLTRSSRLMQQVLPLLLRWLADSPDPDAGLLGLRVLASGPAARTLVESFRDSPELARRLCFVLGTSRRLTEALHRNPDLVPELGALGEQPAVGRFASSLARFKDREELRVGAADVLGLADIVDVGPRLAAMAEAIVQAALDEIAPQLPFAVVAMGRFGGGDLSYGSDLDLLFVYDGHGADDQRAGEVAAMALRDALTTPTAARLYDVDLELRPEGRDGMIARSLEAYRTYFERWAEVWERQAMIRPRPIAGDESLGRGFLAAIAPYVWGNDPTDAQVREIRRIKARVEKERIPQGEDTDFHLKLGPGSLSDVEWTVQLLQLQTGVRGQATLAALASLVERHVVDAAEAEVLETAYRFCERARNRLFLMRGRPTDALPTDGDELARLATSLGTSGTALRDDYRRVTRRARRVTERLFCGRP